MKFEVLQETFSKALNASLKFASPKVQLPVLANILLMADKNKLLVSATNLEISVAIQIGAKVDESGEITVPARIITELIGNLKSGQVTIYSEKEKIEIKSEGFNSVIAGINASDFPKIPQKIEKKDFSVAKGELSKVLSKILFSVSSDETRPVLTGVLAIVDSGFLTFVSTDGFRLSQKKLKVSGVGESTKMIMSKNALNEIVRLYGEEDEIDFFLNKAEGQVILGTPNCVLSSRLIEGEFPDFEKILPKRSLLKATLDRDEFLRSVKLASVFARDSANVVKLKIGKDNIEIVAESATIGSQNVLLDARVLDEENLLTKEFVVAFNYRFLEDFLNSVEGESVEIGFSDPNAPAVFKDSQDKDYLHIIMPVKLQTS